MTEEIYENKVKHLDDIYERVVRVPNQGFFVDRIIRCPECNSAILMVPSLQAMNIAIENHVEFHKRSFGESRFDSSQIAIRVRLSLCYQVLEQASQSVFY